MVLYYRRGDWEADVDHELIGCQMQPITENEGACQYRKSDGTMLTSCQSNELVQLSKLAKDDQNRIDEVDGALPSKPISQMDPNS